MLTYLEVGEANVLVDLFLVGNVDFGIPGLYDAAKEVLKNFQLSDLPEVTYLEPGQSFEIKAKKSSKVGVKAPAGPVLGPPWQHHEKGYLINSPQGQLTLYYEPHCVYNKDFLEKERANIVITLVIKQLLPKFTLVSGLEDAVQLAKLVQAKFIAPMKNGDLDSKGFLPQSFKAHTERPMDRQKVLTRKGQWTNKRCQRECP
uniref:Uncharacterized protein n=1 Tax=Populus trichocarpa TaxID=3694 RepID=A0A2K1YT98_POPTR